MFMHHFIIAIATVGIAAFAAVAPASAEVSHGTPVKQNGQCYKHHGMGSDHQFGTMESCPQPASNFAPHRQARNRS
jgi:hypothetical protein